jgi:L-threonylcarbamoyladenylate synthase
MVSKFKYLEEEQAQAETVRVLLKGGVVIIPSDTLYSLSSSISSAEGYRRILELKDCGSERSFLLLADSISMVRRYICSWGCAEEDRLAQIWPAALTAILPAGSECPKWAGSSVAFRIPDYQPVLNVLAEIGEPILSTSVNISGQAPLHRIEEINKIFGKKVDLVIAGKEPAQDLPSTIVDFTRSKPHLVRQGSYPWEDGLGKPSNSRFL